MPHLRRKFAQIHQHPNIMHSTAERRVARAANPSSTHSVIANIEINIVFNRFVAAEMRKTITNPHCCYEVLICPFQLSK